MNESTRAQLQREYEAAKLAVRKEPGLRLPDPRFKGNDPVYVPDDPGLVALLNQIRPGFEFFGPRIGPSMAADSRTDGKNEVFIQGDFTGNGMLDTVAVVRSKIDRAVAQIIAFLREEGNQYSHKVIPTVASRYTSYLFTMTVGEMREKNSEWAPRHKSHYLPPVLQEGSIEDDRLAFTTNEPFRHTKGWIFADGSFDLVVLSC